MSVKNEMFLRRYLTVLILYKTFQVTFLMFDRSESDVQVENEDEDIATESKQDNLVKIERYKRQIDNFLKPYIDRLKEVIAL